MFSFIAKELTKVLDTPVLIQLFPSFVERNTPSFVPAKIVFPFDTIF